MASNNEFQSITWNLTPEEPLSSTLDMCSQNLEAFDVVMQLIPDQTVTVLLLDHNELDTIPDEITKLKCLKTFSLVGNSLSSLPGSIGLLNSLRTLSLTENHIDILPDEISRLVNLTNLHLMGNQLSSLPDDIGNLCSLENLDLSENSLSCLPPSFGTMSSLKFLDLADNQLVSLCENFGSLTGLDQLNLSNNKLESLPESFGHLVCLAVLDLTNNVITHLPERACFTDTLRELFLDTNVLVSLPPWFGQLKSIVKISLSDNHLVNDALPECFGEISVHLKHLDLSHNDVTVLPSTFRHLVHLEFLDTGSMLPELERKHELLNGNRLRCLPEGFGDLRKLVELRLDENRIEELPTDFGNLVSLQILDLGQDRLEELPDSFCNLTNLHRCSLAVNRLSYLPEKIGNLTKLQSLRLDQNCLERLPESFSKLTHLEHLDLFYNNLPEFPQCLNPLMDTLKSFNIELNGFKMEDCVPRMCKPSYYAERDPEKSDGWRGRNRAEFSISNASDTVYIEARSDASSDEEYSLETRQPPGYRYTPASSYAQKLAAAQALSRKHGVDSNTDTLENGIDHLNPQDEKEMEQWNFIDTESDWDAPAPQTDVPISPNQEDWDTELEKTNPYGTPFWTQKRTPDAAVKAHKLYQDYLPDGLHAASLLSRNSKKPINYDIAEGQFDDVC